MTKRGVRPGTTQTRNTTKPAALRAAREAAAAKANEERAAARNKEGTYERRRFRARVMLPPAERGAPWRDHDRAHAQAVRRHRQRRRH
jgi:hypothetical protein